MLVRESRWCPVPFLQRWCGLNFGIAYDAVINPNWSLGRYSAVRYGEYYFLSSFVLLLASCILFVLAVARYAQGKRKTNSSTIQSVQNLMTELG